MKRLVFACTMLGLATVLPGCDDAAGPAPDPAGPAELSSSTAGTGTIPFKAIGVKRVPNESPVGGTSVEAIRTREDLAALWQVLEPGAPVPDVDLRSRTVIAYWCAAANACSYATIDRLKVHRGTLWVEATSHDVFSFECNCPPTWDYIVIVISTIHWPRGVTETTNLVMEDCEDGDPERSSMRRP